MKRLLLHLVIPALVAVWAVVSALRFEAFSLGMFFGYGVFGFLAYSAPHLLWALVATVSRAPAALCHAGFVAASVALIAILSVSLTGAHDPSGLPLQWVAYWPLAAVLQVLFVGVVAAVRFAVSRVGA
jgi:hypothetical protein